MSSSESSPHCTGSEDNYFSRQPSGYKNTRKRNTPRVRASAPPTLGTGRVKQEDRSNEAMSSDSESQNTQSDASEANESSKPRSKITVQDIEAEMTKTPSAQMESPQQSPANKQVRQAALKARTTFKRGKGGRYANGPGRDIFTRVKKRVPRNQRTFGQLGTGAVISLPTHAFNSVLECSLCHGVLRRCSMLYVCRHKFCRACITRYLVAKPEKETCEVWAISSSNFSAPRMIFFFFDSARSVERELGVTTGCWPTRSTMSW
eukprot:c20177_g1_i5.p1 GENE.c20177_g1_i5~~c20177_g1_i5.p1  ORF type:complete len:262 (-),score=23.19 c20177_g1_i5:572-1357(-)